MNLSDEEIGQRISINTNMHKEKITMNKIDQAFIKMVEFDAGDACRIQHFTKVYQYAHLIGVMEGLDEMCQQNLELAAIVHDIGILPAERKHGRQNGKMQEEIGPKYARKLLEEICVEEEIIERVEFLVGHHHTYKGVNAMDWQILLEADFLVNSLEDEMSVETVEKTMNNLFKTKAGIHICRMMYNL